MQTCSSLLFRAARALPAAALLFCAAPVHAGGATTIFDNETGTNTPGLYVVGHYPGSSPAEDFSIGFSFSVPTGNYYTLAGGSFVGATLSGSTGLDFTVAPDLNGVAGAPVGTFATVPSPSGLSVVSLTASSNTVLAGGARYFLIGSTTNPSATSLWATPEVFPAGHVETASVNGGPFTSSVLIRPGAFSITANQGPQTQAVNLRGTINSILPGYTFTDTVGLVDVNDGGFSDDFVVPIDLTPTASGYRFLSPAIDVPVGASTSFDILSNYSEQGGPSGVALLLSDPGAIDSTGSFQDAFGLDEGTVSTELTDLTNGGLAQSGSLGGGGLSFASDTLPTDLGQIATNFSNQFAAAGPGGSDDGGSFYAFTNGRPIGNLNAGFTPATPEPSPIAALAIGGGLLLLCARLRRSRQKATSA